MDLETFNLIKVNLFIGYSIQLHKKSEIVCLHHFWTVVSELQKVCFVSLVL